MFILIVVKTCTAYVTVSQRITSMSVESFNKIPRGLRIGTGRVPNVWYFDVRYIQLEPPSHVVVLLQPESSLAHTAFVPVGQPQHLGFTFFPETAAEAAGEVAKALIHTFASGTFKKNSSSSTPYAPWSFTTDDRNLAREVGAELKRLGVTAPELWDIKFVPRLRKQADAAFGPAFESIRAARGFPSATFNAPTGISFTNFKIAQWVEPKSSEIDAALAYCKRLADANPKEGGADFADLRKDIRIAIEVLPKRKSATVLSEADAGNPRAALEYSLRLQFGIQCTASRPLCRKYLIKAVLSEKADNTLKSIAHSLLIEWYSLNVFENGTYPNRYINAAAYSTNEAIRLAAGVASPVVLYFAKNTLDKLAEGNIEFRAQYKRIWAAKAKREQEMAEADSKAVLKRMKQPNRYMCATVGCPVMADSGRMLSKCSGKCDADKKPSYCGKECQKADWKNHKPFCRPGAACSVLVRPERGPSASKDGAIEVPVRNPNGTTTFVSSSTLDSETLKEMKAIVEAAGPFASGGLGDAISMERMMI
ncbi:hypothetical protein B0H15DRAFT_865096 [Mycena belliarum]|uniref:MYND-type domain-containing protein n=1 Tax=Mycena belliarum TaxID=1033014 RepID=A0AAD6TTA4_9AGAR|nr:hypothetical protein B0H15DRAFT_865096 [Mycena belliae]